MKFIPFEDKIYVKPIKQDTLLVSDIGQFEEQGEVIAVGSKVKFCKPGDTIFFASWLVTKAPDFNGEVCYVVPEISEAILGKYVSEQQVQGRMAPRLPNSKNPRKRGS